MMRGWSLLVILAGLALLQTVAESSRCEKQSTRPVKKYIIDLDKPPKDRFAETSSDFKLEIAKLIQAQK